jgi:phosphohistidine phosphatase
MALYLAQHARAHHRQEDPEQGISEQGRVEAERIAQAARGHGVKVHVIRHSGKKRARQTAEIFAAALEPRDGVQRIEGMNPLDDVAALAGSIHDAEDAMLVGHLPFLSRLCSLLVTGSADRPVIAFQNGGIVCLWREGGSWVIRWALVPRIG